MEAQLEVVQKELDDVGVSLSKRLLEESVLEGATAILTSKDKAFEALKKSL